MASGTLSRQPGLHLFDTGQSESRAGQSVPVDAWGRPFTATSPPPLNHEERLDARARALFLLDFDHPLAKTSDVYRGVPGLYSAPGEHEAAGEAMRRRRGVCEEMVPTEFLAKWFKEKLEEVELTKRGSPLLKEGMLVYGKRDDGSLVRGKLLSLGRRRSRLITGKIVLETVPDLTRRRLPCGGRGPKKMYTERFRLPNIYPVGGCNGGLETHLEDMVRGHSAESAQGLEGDAGAETLNSSNVLKQMLRTGRSEAGSVLRLYCGSDAAIEKLMLYLEGHKTRMMQAPFDAHYLDLASGDVLAARGGFRSAMARGEEALTCFCQVLADHLFRESPEEQARFTVHLQVTGEYKGGEGKGERFTFVETLKDEKGYTAVPSEGLGREMLSKMRVLPAHHYYARLHAWQGAGRRAAWADAERQRVPETQPSTRPNHPREAEHGGGGGAGGGERFDARKEFLEAGVSLEREEILETAKKGNTWEGGSTRSTNAWQEPQEVSHDLVYEAKDVAGAGAGVIRIYAHKKSDDEIFDLMADKLTGVDALTLSSSERGHSVIDAIHNVLVVKVVVASAGRARSLLAELRAVEWSMEHLRLFGVPFHPKGDVLCTQGVEVLEVQDHLDEEHYLEHLIKYGEWKALAVTIRWWGVPLMLVIKPVDTQYVEQERCRAESYAGHKEKQRQLRSELSHKWPIYNFVRSFFQWVLAGQQPHAELLQRSSTRARSTAPPVSAADFGKNGPPGAWEVEGGNAEKEVVGIAAYRVPAALPRVRVRVHSGPDTDVWL